MTEPTDPSLPLIDTGIPTAPRLSLVQKRPAMEAVVVGLLAFALGLGIGELWKPSGTGTRSAAAPRVADAGAPGPAAIDVVGALSPTLVVSSLGPHYGRSIHRSGTGEWDYDLTWKPIDGFPVRAGWFRAIRRGHAALAAGLAIDAPVLVCCSTASGPNNRWHDAITRTDSVLDVAQIVARAPCLGPMVTVERIADGIHDLSLSAEPARSRFFDTIADWIGGRLPPN